MPERPLLVLKRAAVNADRRKKGGGPQKISYPQRERQAERLGPQFKDVLKAFQENRLKLTDELEGADPTKVLVLETIGSIENFVRAIEKIPGMEALVDSEGNEIEEDEDFHFDVEDTALAQEEARFLPKSLYLVSTNRTAIALMLRLWKRWKQGVKPDRGYTPWATAFAQLKEIRLWNTRDRLSASRILRDWEDQVGKGSERVFAEFELWYRRSPYEQERAESETAALIQRSGGQITDTCLLEEIHYHSLLAELPKKTALDILANNEAIELMRCDFVQYVRATGQSAVDIDLDGEVVEAAREYPVAVDLGKPVVALFDGLPLQQHLALANRLDVYDPDGFEASYPAEERKHGTAMASLILYGDLTANAPPLSRKLFVRPVMEPDITSFDEVKPETLPRDRCHVGLIHKAVREIFSDPLRETSTSEICVINFSIGIYDQMFAHQLSPLARLLDWLAWEYKVLFVISAGNHHFEIDLDDGQVIVGTPTAHEVLNKVVRDGTSRRLLSPAEAINALTVGSAHSDESMTPAWMTDPFDSDEIATVYSAIGYGFRRSVKPDLIAAGGKGALKRNLKRGRLHDLMSGGGMPGQEVAAPTKGISGTTFTRGTSNAAAMVSREACELMDVIDELLRDRNAAELSTVPRALIIKALMANAARWNRAKEFIVDLLGVVEPKQQRELVTRLIGYGKIDSKLSRECTVNRATTVGGGWITRERAHLYEFPLPQSLSGVQGLREFSATLAFFTPVRPRDRRWACADMWFTLPQDTMKMDRKNVDGKASQRGTLQHEVLEGDKAIAIANNQSLLIQVNCRETVKNALDDDIPYVLVTSLQVDEQLGLAVYDEVRARVQARVGVV